MQRPVLLAAQVLLLVAIALSPVLSGCGCGSDVGLFSLPGLAEASCGPAEWIASSRGADRARAAAVLEDGAHFIVGEMSAQTTRFGPGNAAESTPGDRTNRAPYLTSYDAAGTLRWFAYGIAADANSDWLERSIDACPDGGAVMAVAYRGNKLIRDGHGAIHALPAAPAWSLAVMRYAASGGLLWVQTARAHGIAISAPSVVCLASGSIAVVGATDQGASFGGLGDAGRRDASHGPGWFGFVWLLDGRGTTTSVEGVSGGTQDITRAHGFLSGRGDDAGNLWLTARIATPAVSFTDGTPVPGGGPGTADGLVCQWDLARGGPTYVSRLPAADPSGVVTLGEVAPSPDGDLFVSMTHLGSVTLPDGGRVEGTRGSVSSHTSASIVRLDATLRLARWSRTVAPQQPNGGNLGATIHSLDAAPESEVVAVFSHPPQSALGAGQGDASFLLARSDRLDASMVRLTQEGRVRFAHTDGGPGQDMPASVRTLPGGSSLVVGSSDLDPEFAVGTMLYRHLYSGGSWDAWRYIVMDDGYGECPGSALGASGYGYGR